MRSLFRGRWAVVGVLGAVVLLTARCDSSDESAPVTSSLDAGIGGSATDASVDAPPTDGGGGASSDAGGDASTDAGLTGDFPPVADPTFSAAALPADAQLWRTRLLAAINNPAQSPRADTDAATPHGNTYFYGRWLNTYTTSLAHVLRLTGDPEMLVEIHAVAAAMAAQLGDLSTLTYQAGCGAATTDGFLNWQYEYDAGYECTDIHEMDEIGAHASAAHLAYVLDLNRAVDPAYGTVADTLKDYLTTQFISKWRDRKGIPTDFPIFTEGNTLTAFALAHLYAQWTRFHHYMGKLTEDAGYSTEALDMAANLEAHFTTVSTPLGDALQWSHGIPSLGQDILTAQAVNYARYTAQVVMDLYFEGFEFEEHYLTEIANMLAYFVLDNGTTNINNRIDGSEPGGDTIQRWGQSPLAAFAHWDASGEIGDLSAGIHDTLYGDPDQPTQIYTSAGLLMEALLAN